MKNAEENNLHSYDTSERYPGCLVIYAFLAGIGLFALLGFIWFLITGL